MDTRHSLSSLDYSFSPRQALVGAQMLFVAFGALVLVPMLTGLDPNVALFTAGAGTLAFQACTKGRIPIFLASSFAFIAPIRYGMEHWGMSGTLCGIVAAGLSYLLVSLLIRMKGVDAVHKILPPIVTGPIIMVIGLSLAPSAVNMALGKSGDGGLVFFPVAEALPVALIALAATIVTSVYGKGLMKLIPILTGIVAGYAAAFFFGMVNFEPVAGAVWVSSPGFTWPTWNLQAVILFVPIAIAPIIEHVGNVIAVSTVTGRDYTKDPGLHRTLLGDGIATSVAGVFGGPPNTTYAEVVSGIALTRAFNPAVLTWTAICAILLSFVSKLGAVLHSIPTPVMGGIMILLFGAIAVVGMNILVRAALDLMEPRNMAIVAVILVFGIGGMVFQAGDFVLEGIGLAGIVGVLMHLILPGKEQ